MTDDSIIREQDAQSRRTHDATESALGRYGEAEHRKAADRMIADARTMTREHQQALELISQLSDQISRLADVVGWMQATQSEHTRALASLVGHNRP